MIVMFGIELQFQSQLGIVNSVRVEKRQLVRLQSRLPLQRQIDVIIDDPGLEMRVQLVILDLENPKGIVGIHSLT
jgi:hypothetical protein